MKFKINHINWKIKEIESNDTRLITNSDKCVGSTHFFHQIIYLDKAILKDSKRKILIHELVHAFLHETQISKKDEFSEEMVCEMMGLYSDEIINITNKYFKGSR